MSKQTFVVPERQAGERNDAYAERIKAAAKQQGFTAILKPGPGVAVERIIPADAPDEPVRNLRTR